MSVLEKIEIREAINSDLQSIVRMLADDKFGRIREKYSDPLPDSYEHAFNEISKSDDNLLLVAVAEEEIVGVIQVTFIPCLTFTGGRRALIEGVRINKKHRSKGIGRLMIEEATSRAEERGCHLVQLTTVKARSEAKKFYELLGFEATHEGMKLYLKTNAKAI